MVIESEEAFDSQIQGSIAGDDQQHDSTISVGVVFERDDLNVDEDEQEDSIVEEPTLAINLP